MHSGPGESASACCTLSHCLQSLLHDLNNNLYISDMVDVLLYGSFIKPATLKNLDWLVCLYISSFSSRVQSQKWTAGKVLPQRATVIYFPCPQMTLDDRNFLFLMRTWPVDHHYSGCLGVVYGGEKHFLHFLHTVYKSWIIQKGKFILFVINPVHLVLLIMWLKNRSHINF